MSQPQHMKHLKINIRLQGFMTFMTLCFRRLSQPHYFSMTRGTSSTLLLAQAFYFLEVGSGQVWMMVGILWLELKTIWCVCRNSNEMENEEGNDIYINVWCILIFSPFASENLTPGNCREIDNLPNTKYFTQKIISFV